MNSNALPVSVVIPVRDEAAAIETLIREISQALADREHEIIVVDDGSSDGTDRILQSLTARQPNLRFSRHPVSRGQSSAIRSGVRMAEAPLIVTLDGDGQNPPDQIPLLLQPFTDAPEDLGLVQGQRAGRQDTLAKKLSSRIANRIRGGAAEGRGARFGMRAEGLSPRGLSGPAVFRPYSPLHARDDAARGLAG